MNEAEQTPLQDVIDVRQLARAIRFALVGIILGLTYLGYRYSLHIEPFSQAFADMFGDRPLPTITVFLRHTRYLFIAISVLAPAIAIATLFLRSLVRSFYILGVLGLATSMQIVLIHHGLSAPLIYIIHQMRDG